MFAQVLASSQSSDPLKTKGRFTHKNILMMHDQANKEGKGNLQ